MRILQFIDSLAVGGAERMAVNLANLFTRKGIPNILITSREIGPLQVYVTASESLFCLEKKSTLDIIAFARLVKIAKKFKPTHLHVHDSSIYWAALLKKFLPNTTLIWHAHYGGLVGDEGRFGSKIKYISSHIDLVITVNQELRNWVKRGFSDIKEVAYIENFPDLPQKINRGNTRPEILCLANLKTPKNHHLLIRSFAEFLKKFPHYKLKLVGSTDDQEYVNSLKEEIAALNIQASVIFAGETLDLISSFEDAEFAVLSSDIEGLPVSLLELGLAQVPIIATWVGQCKELLGKGKFGFLTPPGDEKKLYEMLIFVAENRKVAIDKASSFYTHVSEKYGFKNFIDKYYILLNQNN
jgi:glycosyltransferase involved in cell wall biosynthesis